MTRKIVVGSRESALAVVQSMALIDHLKAAHPELEISLLTMKTTGDKILDRTLDKVGGKGLFVKELDLALIYYGPYARYCFNDHNLSLAKEALQAGIDEDGSATIQIDGQEYSTNMRGFNIVVYNKELGQLIDSAWFDTHIRTEDALY